MSSYFTFGSLADFLAQYDIFAYGSHNPDRTLGVTVERDCTGCRLNEYDMFSSI